MPKDAACHIETLREKLRTDERDVDEPNHEALLEFSDEFFLIPSQVGDYRHLKLLRHNVRTAEHAESPVDALESEDAAIEIVRWFHRTYDNPETNWDYRVALKQFGRRVTDRNGDYLPESMALISSSDFGSYDFRNHDFFPMKSDGEFLKLIGRNR